MWKIKPTTSGDPRRRPIRRLRVSARDPAVLGLCRSSSGYGFSPPALQRRLALLTCFFPPPLPPFQSHHKRRQSHHLLPPSYRSKVAHSRITFPPSSFSRNPSRLLAKRTDALGSRANSSSSSCSSAATSSAKCDFLKPPSKPPWLSLIVIRLSASHVFRLQHHQHKDDDTQRHHCTTSTNVRAHRAPPRPLKGHRSLSPPSAFPEITSHRAHAAPPPLPLPHRHTGH